MFSSEHGQRGNLSRLRQRSAIAVAIDPRRDAGAPPASSIKGIANVSTDLPDHPATERLPDFGLYIANAEEATLIPAIRVSRL